MTQDWYSTSGSTLASSSSSSSSDDASHSSGSSESSMAHRSSSRFAIGRGGRKSSSRSPSAHRGSSRLQKQHSSSIAAIPAFKPKQAQSSSRRRRTLFAGTLLCAVGAATTLSQSFDFDFTFAFTSNSPSSGGNLRANNIQRRLELASEEYMSSGGSIGSGAPEDVMSFLSKYGLEVKDLELLAQLKGIKLDAANGDGSTSTSTRSSSGGMETATSKNEESSTATDSTSTTTTTDGVIQPDPMLAALLGGASTPSTTTSEESTSTTEDDKEEGEGTGTGAKVDTSLGGLNSLLSSLMSGSSESIATTTTEEGETATTTTEEAASTTDPMAALLGSMTTSSTTEGTSEQEQPEAALSAPTDSDADAVADADADADNAAAPALSPEQQAMMMQMMASGTMSPEQQHQMMQMMMGASAGTTTSTDSTTDSTSTTPEMSTEMATTTSSSTTSSSTSSTSTATGSSLAPFEPTAQAAPGYGVGGMTNFKDSWEPWEPSDIPVFFHIPKAGGSTVKDNIGSCHRFTMATEYGVSDGHDQDTEIAVVYPAGGPPGSDRSPFVNVDTTTVAGIQRAKDMGFADAGLADAVVTGFLYEANELFTPTAKGRLFTVFRHPIERAISMFYYIQVADWEPTYSPDLKDWTIEQYAESDRIENNWMTRQLSGSLSGDLTDEALNVAMEVIRSKFLVGLMSEMDRTMERFEKFFRWKYKVNPPNQEACRERLMSGGSNSNSSNKKEKPKEGDTAWEKLMWQNSYDMQLYEYIVELFEEQEAFVSGIPDGYRLLDATCCKCDPPTFPPEGYECPKAIQN